MTMPPAPARLRVLSTLLTSVTMSYLTGMTVAAAQPAGGGSSAVSLLAGDNGREKAGRSTVSSARKAWLASLTFATAADAKAFEAISARVAAVTPPDSREVARAFIREHLKIDGDDYIVAHFRGPGGRRRGNPDHTVPLVDAVMEAFPEQAGYSTFAAAADAVGGVGSGGRSPGVVELGEHLIHASSVRGVFGDLWHFLWSRTGPGYLYTTFFAKGNVVETVKEESRDVDEAFGIFRKGGFTPEYESPHRLSDILVRAKARGVFGELPYILRLKGELDTYWREHRANWAVVARYQFVLRARAAHASGTLDDKQFKLVMRGGAPHVPLSGPITLDHLRTSSRDASVQVRRFDINGYTASNLVRFVADDGSEVMYVPGFDPSFVVADSEQALRQWVYGQAQDPHALDALLSHFSIRDSQDGVFWTGVRHGLEKIGNGQWQHDGRAIDHADAAITGDVFDDMRDVTERRTRADALVQTRNAWETWRVTVSRTAALLSPLGFIRPLVIPVQVALAVVDTGTGIEQGLDGKTLDERKRGFEQAGITLVSTALTGAALGGRQPAEPGAGGEPVAGLKPTFRPPQRINGRVGYLASPARAPRFPGLASRIYLSRGGRLALWSAEDYVEQTWKNLPRGATEVSPGIFRVQDRLMVKLENGRAMQIVPDGADYRALLRNRTLGPRMVPRRGAVWEFDFAIDNHMPGSFLANVVANDYSADPRALNRAAQVLHQFGSSEASVRDADAGMPGPLARVALAHGVLETLAAKLRDSHAVGWTPREVELLLPSIAEQVSRSIALFEGDEFRFGMRPDGTEFDARNIPDEVIRLRHADGHYALVNNPHPGPSGWYSVFRLVGRALGDAASTGWEEHFRKTLAENIESRSTLPELEIIHRRWIDPLDLPEGRKRALKMLSGLRQALVDPHAVVPADMMAKLRAADRSLRAELFPGESDPWPWLDDVLARKHEQYRPGNAGDAPFLMLLLTRIAEEEDGLLPRGLDHLVVKTPSVLSAAGAATADQWRIAGRHYVRLRHLDGRTQVVETEAPEAGNYLQILAPGEGPDRATGRYVVDLDGEWFPEEGVRNGLNLMPPVTDLQAFVNVDVRPPPTKDADFTVIERMVNSIPQPILRLVGTSLPEAGLTAQGAVEFSIRNPATGMRISFPTHLDPAGNPARRAARAPLPPDTLAISPPDRQLVMPVPERGAPRAGAADATAYLAMLRDERPISAFVEAGFGDRHIKVLVQTRRLRGLLREDGHVAVVGATPEHAFTLVMPVDANSLGFVSTGAVGARAFANLPPHTYIVDSMYGVSTTARDYPSAIRAVARRWEADGVSMTRVERNGSETRESAVAFTERLLSSPVRANLWNPEGDPISETGYVRYMRRLYERYGTLRHAGLDWLGSRAARRDYMSYFAKPYDVMPTWNAPPATEAAAKTLHELARTAVQVLAPPGSPPVM